MKYCIVLYRHVIVMNILVYVDADVLGAHCICFIRASLVSTHYMHK